MDRNTGDTQFRIIVGSYEHNLLCVSALLNEKSPLFQPVFHFEAHSLSIKSIDVGRRYLVTGSNDEHIRIYDLQKRKELGNLLSHQGTVTTLKFSSEQKEAESTEKSGKWLLSGSEDGKIIIWRTKDWEAFGTLKGHLDRVNDLDIHPTGRVAISVSKDSTVRLWNLMTAKKAAILKIKGRDSLGQAPEFVRWSPDGTHFVVGLLNKVFLYETSNAKIFKKLKFKSTIMCMEVIQVHDKSWLVIGNGSGAIEFYDLKVLCEKAADFNSEQDQSTLPLEDVTPEFSLRGHTNRIKDVTFICHPTETKNVPYLVSVSSDGKIVIWDLTEDIRDQVAVYDSGERLNCVAACFETIEKSDTMKRRLDSTEGDNNDFSESEYETDGEEVKKVLNKRSKKDKKKNKKSKITVTRE